MSALKQTDTIFYCKICRNNTAFKRIQKSNKPAIYKCQTCGQNIVEEAEALDAILQYKLQIEKYKKENRLKDQNRETNNTQGRTAQGRFTSTLGGTVIPALVKTEKGSLNQQENAQVGAEIPGFVKHESINEEHIIDQNNEATGQLDVQISVATEAPATPQIEEIEEAEINSEQISETDEKISNNNETKSKLSEPPKTVEPKSEATVTTASNATTNTETKIKPQIIEVGHEKILDIGVNFNKDGFYDDNGEMYGESKVFDKDTLTRIGFGIIVVIGVIISIIYTV